jgi:hypothetical protein
MVDVGGEMTVQISESDGVGKKKQGRPPENNRYRTTDIEMATVLISLGHKCVDLGEKKENRTRRILFIFEHNKVKDDLRKWINGELSVEPRSLLNNYADLKNLVHNKNFQ